MPPGSSPSTTALPRGTENILLIDDNEILRAAMRRALEAHGYTALEATDGEAAIERLAGYDAPIDLVITDIVMPGLTGRALIERLAIGRSPFKVLFISGYPGYVLAHGSLQELGAELLEKPFGMADFVRAVRDVLDDERRGRGTDGIGHQS